MQSIFEDDESSLREPGGTPGSRNYNLGSKLRSLEQFLM